MPALALSAQHPSNGAVHNAISSLTGMVAMRARPRNLVYTDVMQSVRTQDELAGAFQSWAGAVEVPLMRPSSNHLVKSEASPGRTEDVVKVPNVCRARYSNFRDEQDMETLCLW